MTREEFLENMSKYFSLSQIEVDKMVNAKFGNDKDKRRFLMMLDVIIPHLEPWLEKVDAEGKPLVDEKLKRKVGKVFLQKLDYSSFYEKETLSETQDRIRGLFYKICSKGINPYKIIYCQVLTDGDLKRDSESRSKYYDSSRDFDRIYDSLAENLIYVRKNSDGTKQRVKLSKEEINAIFERCSTLIAKGYAYKFPHVYNKLAELYVYDTQAARRCLNTKEIFEILKINPSLFVLSTDRIQDAFDYLQRKMRPIWVKEAEEEMKRNPNMTLLDYMLGQTRTCLKNNSSLLTLNSSNMFEKEKILRDVNLLTEKVYAHSFAELFKDPTTLAIINQIPTEKITKNALKNIRKLEEVIEDKTKIAKYIEKNQYMIGMDYAKFGSLVDEIVHLDKLHPEEQYIDKFLTFGKTLFASNIDFSVSTIIEKLKNNYVMIDLDVDNLTDKECLHQFVEIFFDGNHELTRDIERLMKEKLERVQLGEKSIRGEIRSIGKSLAGLSVILKDDKTTTKDKRERILKLATDIGAINNARFRCAQTDFPMNVKYEEMEVSEQIEKDLNLLREVYEQKRFKLGKRYSNLDQLFERTMDYLGRCFDDKMAITDLFRKEITTTFNEEIINTYETRPYEQQQLFGQTLVVEGVGQSLRKPLETINLEVNRIDYDENGISLIFEK